VQIKEGKDKRASGTDGWGRDMGIGGVEEQTADGTESGERDGRTGRANKTQTIYKQAKQRQMR